MLFLFNPFSISRYFAAKRREFFSEQLGAVAMISAFVMPVLILISLIAVDFTRMQNARSKVQSSVDAAVLAASVEAGKLNDLDNIEEVLKSLNFSFEPFLLSNLGKGNYLDHELEGIEYFPETRRVEAVVSFRYPSLVRAFNREDNKRYQVAASTYLSGKQKNSLSMMLVLDKSGSMWMEGRMTALKTAVSALSKQFNEDDPDKEYIRVGAVAYDSRLLRQRVRPQWGSNNANSFAQGLRPHGGTNSTAAVRTAYRFLNLRREEREHAKRNEGELQRVILFMTDGENNNTKHDVSTLRFCNVAKRQEIQIYTVAFRAPPRGQSLLERCASSPENYFPATSAEELIAAFKLIGETALRRLAISS
ncbi:MAG: vWA domain-containing protein [Rhizobiaceae bacterium]